MTTHRMHSHSLIPLITVGLLLLATGCDNPVSPEDTTATSCFSHTDGTAIARAGQGFTIEIASENGGLALGRLLFSASGAVVDQGEATGDFTRAEDVTYAPTLWHGTQTLTGGNGTLVLRFQGQRRSRAPLEVRGCFTLEQGGTESHARLQGAGSFLVTLDGAGRLRETFIGRVRSD